MKRQFTICAPLCLVVSAMAMFTYFASSYGQVIPHKSSIIQSTKVPKVGLPKTITEKAQNVSLPTPPPNQEKNPIINERLIDGHIITSSKDSYPLRHYEMAAIPNDPRASQSWVTSTNIDKAWDVPRGSASTLLAVIDTGFALAHEEFDGRWYVNSGEAGPSSIELTSQLNCTDSAQALNERCNLIDDDFDGVVDNESGPTSQQNPSMRNCTDRQKPIDKSCNLIDDDSNGFVDDFRGWDFYNYDNSVQAGEIDSDGEGTHHGTYVTGVAAANSNNAKGIAGVDEATKILPLQALADDGYGNTISVARAIRYAVSQKADVISLSLGSSSPDSYTRQAVREAVAAGIIVVAASGNGGCECMIFPANYPEVVAVGALNSSNQPASFSAWGSNLDIVAPGTGFYTTDWRPTRPTNAYASGISGTSLATPVVSGMLTRMLSYSPDLSPLQAIAALTESTNRLALPVSPSHSKTFGFGALDGEKSSLRVRQPLAPIINYAYGAISIGNILNPLQPNEFITPSTIYECTSPLFGTTPVYEVSNSSRSFFTVSSAEASAAEQQGYTTKITTYACMLLPHDQSNSITRTINFMREFKNSDQKLP